MSHSLYIDETPDEVKNAKGLHLITGSTSHGQKVPILLEELKQKYGLQFTTTVLDLKTKEQKKEWFLRLNPNGKIPLLIDNTRSPPFPVFETSNILLYLAESYDPGFNFHFSDALERSQALQWLFFWHGSGGPYLGQTYLLKNVVPEKVPYAIERFHNETLRAFGVLEIHLSGKYTGVEREYLAGAGTGKYSVADIGTWPCVNYWKVVGFSEEEVSQFPHLMRWKDRIAAREAIKKGTGEAYAKK